ncbi:hypothetical protein HanHA300_Chr02g0061001 [Helianthus annuus]|nr:hypothetical protein HanHA300_Chr02g0061001 [Helianthus annuus]KAJ0777723.1 hypothetical protein HanLR1_Chr02g0063781 [Helianthus annuus]KAJ0786740.1 hypothetical protein HanOQP8_Chr02g0074771 [Helianthus annuus]
MFGNEDSSSNEDSALVFLKTCGTPVVRFDPKSRCVMSDVLGMRVTYARR